MDYKDMNAIGIVRLMLTDGVISVEQAARYFPELGGSEDEVIREILIQIVKGACDKYGIKYQGQEIGEEKLLAWLEKQGEQRSKLVDFDLNANDSDLQEATYFIPNGFHAEIIGDKVVIKKGEKKPTEWSDEDEEIYRRCICSMRASACGFPEEEKFVEKVDNWLKSLKDRVQPKQEWSEEDENHIKRIIEHLEGRKKDLKTQWVAELHNKEIDWLKSLSPQNRWKPSEEQMAYLSAAIEESNENAILKSLYQDLMKLREE